MSADSGVYTVMVALTDVTYVDAWVKLGLKLADEHGHVRLRGMVTIPEGQSLSEGATQARAIRDQIRAVALADVLVEDSVEVRVDYHPMAAILEETDAEPVDLLLAQWAGPTAHTGGLNTDEILQHARCDVVLLHGDDWHVPGRVLLSLRGGPNLTLGVKVAEALAGDSGDITLFHAVDRGRSAPDLGAILRGHSRIARTMTSYSDTMAELISEAAHHKAIVMGARFQQPEILGSSASPVMTQVYQAVDKPMVLVRAWHPEEVRFHAPSTLVRPELNLSARVDRWFAENTFHSSEFDDLRALMGLKERQGVTISVALPALNEEETVGLVIDTVKSALMDEVPLVDEIVLIDSMSTDNTVSIAEARGIPVYRHPEILPEVGSYRGKGEALWKSLHVTTGDIVAWIDTDISNIHPRFVYGLLGPLLRRPQLQYVKGFYQRPIKVGDTLQAYGGGRVTELVARPLLNLYYPELSGIIQPLSGEYAGRRAALESLPFFSGYGVETGLLIDMHDRFGLDAIAQTDLEQRVHHNQPLVGLSKMSFAILQVFISRLENRYGVSLLDHANKSMKLVAQAPDRFALDVVEITDVERPAMNTIPAYMQRYAVSST
jgi:glucosyl-3-phosphoglycerate synthase